MAKRGGPRPGAGRPVGAVQRARPEQKKTLSDLAREHTADALSVLVLIATQGESEAARVSAANALLDRGYGKPQQSVEMSGRNGSPLFQPLTPAEAMREVEKGLGDGQDGPSDG